MHVHARILLLPYNGLQVVRETVTPVCIRLCWCVLVCVCARVCVHACACVLVCFREKVSASMCHVEVREEPVRVTHTSVYVCVHACWCA